MTILCSRLKCGCLASALLYDIPSEVARFYRDERAKGREVDWEERKEVWAEKCPTHEEEARLRKEEKND